MQRNIRLNRFKSEVKRHNGEGVWAVSYADFLMVLLSFFIVFFSIDRGSSLHHIFKNLTVTKGSGSGEGSGDGSGTIKMKSNVPVGAAVGNSANGTGLTGTGTGHGIGAGTTGGGQPDRAIESIARELASVASVSAKLPRQVTLDFPENIYKVGGYQAPKELLDTVITAVGPYVDGVNITIVGHSDTTAFSKAKASQVMRYNLTLSSVRAAYASTYLMEKLPTATIYTRASSDVIRATRSLTIVIEEKRK